MPVILVCLPVLRSKPSPENAVAATVPATCSLEVGEELPIPTLPPPGCKFNGYGVDILLSWACIQLPHGALLVTPICKPCELPSWLIRTIPFEVPLGVLLVPATSSLVLGELVPIPTLPAESIRNDSVLVV